MYTEPDTVIGEILGFGDGENNPPFRLMVSIERVKPNSSPVNILIENQTYISLTDH